MMGRSYGNATQTIASELAGLDRVEFYPDVRDDFVKFEVIIWKRSQTTEVIGKIEGYPRGHHSYFKMAKEFIKIPCNLQQIF